MKIRLHDNMVAATVAAAAAAAETTGAKTLIPEFSGWKGDKRMGRAVSEGKRKREMRS